MNKARFFGLILIISGLVISFYFEDNKIDFFAGLLIGAGVPFIFTGRLRFWKWKTDSN